MYVCMYIGRRAGEATRAALGGEESPRTVRGGRAVYPATRPPRAPRARSSPSLGVEAGAYDGGGGSRPAAGGEARGDAHRRNRAAAGGV